jgi:hypothetical protein
MARDSSMAVNWCPRLGFGVGSRNRKLARLSSAPRVFGAERAEQAAKGTKANLKSGELVRSATK